jgi:DNA-binding Xre family transcriptional regulator
MIDDVYIAPDVVRQSGSVLAHPPRFLPGPDALIALYLRGQEGWRFDGFVTAVHPLGELAAVYVQSTLAHHAPPTHDLYIVRADALPRPRPRVYVHARIGAVCREQGISARQLAERLGVAVDVARWLMAEALDRIDTEHLDRLCEMLNVQPGDLFVLRDIPRPTTLTLREAAAYLRVRPSRLKRAVRHGRLKGCKEQGQWQFDWADIVEYMKRGR